MSLILSIVTKLSKLSTSSATLSCEQQTTTKMHNKNRPRLNRSTMFVVGLTYLLSHSKKKISTFRTEIPRKPIKFGYFGGFQIIKLDFFEPLHISCHFKTERKKKLPKINSTQFFSFEVSYDRINTLLRYPIFCSCLVLGFIEQFVD